MPFRGRSSLRKRRLFFFFFKNHPVEVLGKRYVPSLIDFSRRRTKQKKINMQKSKNRTSLCPVVLTPGSMGRNGYSIQFSEICRPCARIEEMVAVPWSRVDEGQAVETATRYLRT